MGRKPIDKERIDNPKIKEMWAKELSPLFLQSGMRKYTMDDVAEKLGVSKATLYKYFRSRKDILEAIIQMKLKEVDSFRNYLSEEHVPYPERYMNAARIVTTLMVGISNQFLMDMKEMHRDLWKTLRGFQDEVLDLAREFYKKGIELGYLHTDLDPNILAVTDRMFIRAVSDPKFLMEHKLNLQKTIENYFIMKTKGIFKKDFYG